MMAEVNTLSVKGTPVDDISKARAIPDALKYFTSYGTARPAFTFVNMYGVRARGIGPTDY